MEFRYKTVIIGAGPAGSSCALSLRKRGEEPCLIDRAVFPRHKTCAGLVTSKTYRLIQALYPADKMDTLFTDATSTVRLLRKTTELVTASVKEPVHFVNRSHFDNALVDEYKRIGGVIREGERAFEIDYDNSRVILSNGDELCYQYLIFADGALSQSHKLLHVDKRKLAFGIEAYIPAEQLSISAVDLSFGYLKSGYVWLFPHGDTVCIGAANQYDPHMDYHKLFSEILSDFGMKDEGINRYGAFLPYGEVIPQEKLPENILLLGDAGGFADPISGEGLYMALQTGIYAAEAIVSDDPKHTYLNSVKPLAAIIKEGKKTQNTFYSPLTQSIFLSKVRGSSNIVSYFLENMVQEYNYDYGQLPRLLREYKNQKG